MLQRFNKIFNYAIYCIINHRRVIQFNILFCPTKLRQLGKFCWSVGAQILLHLEQVFSLISFNVDLHIYTVAGQKQNVMFSHITHDENIALTIKQKLSCQFSHFQHGIDKRKLGILLLFFHISVAFWPQKMAKKQAICPICYSPICPLEHLIVSNHLIINRLQNYVRQIGQIGQKQIGQIHFCTLFFRS